MRDMQYDARRSAKFKRFDKVSVAERFKSVELVRMSPDITGKQIAGRRGTVIWCRPAWCDPRTGWKEWAYCVSLVPETCLAFLSPIFYRPAKSTPRRASSARGSRLATTLDDDSAILEELPTAESVLEVFRFTKDVPQLAHRFTTWESGITGVVMEVTKETTIDFGLVERSMSLVFGATTWERVAGPDSGFLKCYFENDNPLNEQRKS